MTRHSFALFTSSRGDYVRVARARLIDEPDLRIYAAVIAALVIVTGFLTFILETNP